MTELFSYGDTNTDFTGGLIQHGNVTINSNQDGLIKMNQGNGNDDFLITGKKINWSNFNTVYFDCVSGSRNRAGRLVLYYSASNINNTQYATQVNEVSVSGNGNVTYTIDIQSMTGSYYFIISCYVSGSTLFTYCDISRVYLI